ncbi:MAG: c-type cytochrome [Verrucomicrobiales bacterium]|nr:c-type cytochrome [Verrucomicrobiales bacterium]
MNFELLLPSLVAAGFCLLGARPFAAENGGADSDASSRVLWADFVENNFPFFSSTLDARKLGNGCPEDNLTPRGLILNLGLDCWACFDTDLLRMSAFWVGKGISARSMSQISYHSPGLKSKDGQGDLPKIVGTPWLVNGIYPGWQASGQFSLTDPREPGPDANEVGRGPLDPAAGQFKAIRLTRDGACLEYEVAGARVREWVQTDLQNGECVFQRSFRLDRAPQTLWLILGRAPLDEASRFSVSLEVIQPGRGSAIKLVKQPDGLWVVRLEPFQEQIEFSVAMGRASAVRTWGVPGAADMPALTRWPQTLTTRGSLSPATNAYVVDNIALPLVNPWRRNVRPDSLAFFNDGRAAAVTFDGDVWLISGLNGDLNSVQWRRFASGLHEPQSLCIRDEEIFVFDRNGIWQLRDTDRNGEADVHKLFSNAFAQTAETREYAQAMKLAPDGSFIVAKGGIQMSTLGKHNGTVMRISRDGQSAQVIGSGLRSPYLGVHPKTGLITASDQQGHYVPTTPLHLIRERQFYGFLSSRWPKERYPAPVAEPLTWVPYPINASGANQAWLVGARMGPINDGLIHFGYYRPEIFLVLLHQRLPRLHAAVVSVTRDLEFPPCDGAVNPIDGQLYFTGFQIFGTAAKQIGGLARLRYTGGPSTLPREVVAMDKGVLLRFDIALDEKAADSANFSAERWNYKRTANYGSPHFKLDGSKGQETMVPSSAYLSKDRKCVFIGIPEMKPAMQMRVGWALTAQMGMEFQQNAYFTPHEMAPFDPASEGFDPVTVDLVPKTAESVATTTASAEEGKRLAELMGCVACHSSDGSAVEKVGPTWKGLFGSQVALSDGRKAVADEAYLRESIKEPAAQVVSGFDKSEAGMPSYEGVISDTQIESLILYIKTIK